MTRRAVDLSLYLVLDAGITHPERFPELALAAVNGGAGIVQIRDKTGSARQMIAATRAVIAAVRPLGVPVVVNDRVDVAAAAGADGAHVGQDDLPPADARALLGPDALLGLSVTNAAEIATVDPSIVDHVGLGPLYATRTKPDAATPLGRHGFHAIRRQLALPVVAIGGIDAAGAAGAIEAGADGIAVVTAIARADDPEQAARALRRIVAEAKRR